MSRRVLIALALVLAVAAPVAAASPAPRAARDDYANAAFSGALGGALRAFYARDFAGARSGFDAALALIPDNTLAISFVNAAAAQTPGQLDVLTGAEEDAVAKAPRSVLAHVRLAFSYLFATAEGRDRRLDAREELGAALALDPGSQSAHTASGIMREAERSTSRAKSEFLAALESDPKNVLAREYLARIYQVDLKDPQRALTTIIDIPNLVPEYADIDFHLASLLQDLGQNAAAVTYATRGLQLDLGRVGEAGQHGYTLLAEIYASEKKFDDARRALRAAISAGTDVAYAGTLLKKLDDGRYGKPAPSPAAVPKKK